jgi:hypothetical protein
MGSAPLDPPTENRPDKKERPMPTRRKDHERLKHPVSFRVNDATASLIEARLVDGQSISNWVRDQVLDIVGRSPTIANPTTRRRKKTAADPADVQQLSKLVAFVGRHTGATVQAAQAARQSGLDQRQLDALEIEGRQLYAEIRAVMKELRT